MVISTHKVQSIQAPIAKVLVAIDGLQKPHMKKPFSDVQERV